MSENTDNPLADEPTEQERDRVKDWPLSEDKAGFFPPVRSSHYVSSGHEVVALQGILGVEQTGLFDEATSEAVLAFKKKRRRSRLTPGVLVDRATWEALQK